MKKIILTLVIGSIILAFMHFTGIEINNWYIWLPVYLISLIIARFTSFLGTNAIIEKFGFHGSKKDGNKFTTHFNVAFVVGLGKSVQLSAIIDSDAKMTKNDVLNIISSTEKKKIIQAYKEMEEGSALFSIFFEYEYEYLGDNIIISYKPLEKLDFKIGGVYEDRK